jgi:pyrroloquinoline quinone (PQQ) biosynthesis protein C
MNGAEIDVRHVEERLRILEDLVGELTKDMKQQDAGCRQRSDAAM